MKEPLPLLCTDKVGKTLKKKKKTRLNLAPIGSCESRTPFSRSDMSGLYLPRYTLPKVGQSSSVFHSPEPRSRKHIICVLVYIFGCVRRSRNGKTLAHVTRAQPLGLMIGSGSVSLVARAVCGRTLIVPEFGVLRTEPLELKLVTPRDILLVPTLASFFCSLSIRPSLFCNAVQEDENGGNAKRRPAYPGSNGLPGGVLTGRHIAQHQAGERKENRSNRSKIDAKLFFALVVTFAVIQVVEKINDTHVKGLSWWSWWVERTFIGYTSVTLCSYYSIRVIYLSIFESSGGCIAYWFMERSTKSSINQSCKLCICTSSLGYGALRKLVPEEIVGQKYKMRLRENEEEAKRLSTFLYLLTTYFLENKVTPPHVLVLCRTKYARRIIWQQKYGIVLC